MCDGEEKTPSQNSSFFCHRQHLLPDGLAITRELDVKNILHINERRCFASGENG